jgi:serine/threonine protein kinase HipA of HipAB toxin-antitoxin module
MRYKSHGPRCDCGMCRATGCGAFSHARPMTPAECEETERITRQIDAEADADLRRRNRQHG